MSLPEDLDKVFWQEVQAYEEARHVSYITSVERIGIEKGIQQGIQQGMQQGIQQGHLERAREDVIDILAARFEPVPEAVVNVIRQTEDVTVLKHLLKTAAIAGSLSEFTPSLPEPGPDRAATATP